MPTSIKNKTHVLREMKEKEEEDETKRCVLVLHCGFYDKEYGMYGENMRKYAML